MIAVDDINDARSRLETRDADYPASLGETMSKYVSGRQGL